MERQGGGIRDAVPLIDEGSVVTGEQVVCINPALARSPPVLFTRRATELFVASLAKKSEPPQGQAVFKP